MVRHRKPAVLLLFISTLLASLSFSNGSSTTTVSASGATQDAQFQQLLQKMLSDLNMKESVLKLILPVINNMLSTATNTTDSPLTNLLQTVFNNMIGSTNNANLSSDVIGKAEAQGMAAFLEAMKNPVVKGVLPVVPVLIGEIMKHSNGTLPPVAAWPKALASVGTLPLIQQVLSSGVVRELIPNLPPGQVNKACYEDSMDTVDSLFTMKQWALDMFDATGKIESGIQKGHFYFIGSYDQCYDARPKVEKHYAVAGGTTITRTFGTRFCRADIKISDTLIKALNVDTRGVKLKLTWGLCVPDSCKSRDIQGFFNIGPLYNSSLPIESVYCYDEENLSSDKSAIVAICVLSVFAFIIAAGTLIDACRAYFAEENEKVESSVSNTSPTGKYTVSDDTKYIPSAFYGISNEKHGPSSGGGLSSTPIDGYDFSSPGNNVTSFITADNNIPNGEVTTIKAEMEIGLPAGYIPHQETGIEIVRSDTPVKNGGLQQMSTEHSSRIITKKQDPLLIRLLLCFSVYTNIPKILHAKGSSGSVACIHGIRFFSLTWVVLGHTYNYGIISMEETFNAANLLDFVGILQRFTYQGVVAGGFAVDTFFVLSAFLLTWLHLKDTAKKKKKFTLEGQIYYYFHRFWRLTPIYMFVLMAFSCLYKYLGSGPMWPSSITTAENCKKSWWTNLLYVNNLVNLDNQCMGWTWYLANDMQFYVISPLFLIVMYMSPVLGALLTGLLLSTGMGVAFWREYIYNGNFFTMKEDGGDYWRKVYIVPWCRVGCWAVGMLLGLLIYKRGQKLLQNKIVIRLGWLLATAVALFLVYIPYTEQKEGGKEWTRVERAFYEGFGRPAWGVCVAWVIFACHYGKGGIVNTILSWNGFIPLSRLTYAAYLVHPICMMINIWSRRTLLYINDYSIIYLFLGHLCMTYMVAFVCSLAFEAPFMALEKLILRKGRRS